MGKKIWKHKNATMKRGDTIVVDGKPTDVVIAIMGPPGVGKSTFIDALFGKGTASPGHCLRSIVSQVEHFIRPLPSDPARRLVVVEMPGFDDTYMDEAEILRRISVWLATSYTNDMKLAGIIYLHNIWLTRIAGNARLNLEMFRKLCGDDALPSVVLGTTHWSEVARGVGEDRLQGLKTNVWRDMIVRGSYVFKFDNTKASAWSMVNYLLEKRDYDALQLQKELVDLQKIIPDTSAGKELRYMLEQRLKIQWDDATDEQLQKTSTAIQKLKVPIPLRLKLLFGIDSFHEGTTTTVIKHEKRVTRTVEVNTNVKRNNVTRPRDTTTSASKVNTSRTEEANTNVKGNNVSRPSNTTTSASEVNNRVTVEANTNVKGNDVSSPSATTTYASEINRVSVPGPKEVTVSLSSVEEKENSRSTRFAGEVPSKADLTPRRGGSSSTLELATGNPIVDGRDNVAVSCDDVRNDSRITTAPDVTQVDLPQSPDYCRAAVDSTAIDLDRKYRVEERITEAASLKTTSSFDNGCTTLAADKQTATQVTAGVTTAPDVSQVDLPRTPDCNGAPSPVESTNNTAKLNSNSEAQRSTAVVFERTYSVESRITETASIVTPSEQPEESFNNGGTTADNQAATQVTADITTAPDVTQVDLPQSCTAPFDNENSTAELNSAAQGITALVIERRCSVESLVIEAASVKTTLQKKGSATDIQHATQANTDDVLQKSHQITSTTVTETQTTTVKESQIFGNARDFGISGAVLNEGANPTIHYTHTENHTTNNNDTHLHLHFNELDSKARKFISRCIEKSKGDAELDNDGVHIRRRKTYVVGSSKKRSRLAKHGFYMSGSQGDCRDTPLEPRT